MSSFSTAQKVIAAITVGVIILGLIGIYYEWVEPVTAFIVLIAYGLLIALIAIVITFGKRQSSALPEEKSVRITIEDAERIFKQKVLLDFHDKLIVSNSQSRDSGKIFIIKGEGQVEDANGGFDKYIATIDSINPLRAHIIRNPDLKEGEESVEGMVNPIVVRAKSIKRQQDILGNTVDTVEERISSPVFDDPENDDDDEKKPEVK